VELMMRRLAAVAAALTVSLLAVPTAWAAPFPDSIPLPVDFQPEGITVGTGSTFYVGSLWDGDIYRGSLRSGEGQVFIDVSGRQALGMKVDEGRHLLFVAGGFTGHAYVYSTRTGATVADLTLGTPGASLVNDVALTRDAAYFTETFAPVIYKVPINADGTIGPPEPITVTGPAGVSVPGTFGLNGIVASPDGSKLLVNHSDLGILATIDADTGESRQVDITGGALVPGTPDGLVLAGHTAWVVENFANSVAEVRLSPDFSTGQLVQTITDSAFRVPTTAAIHGSRLALVNGRVDLGFPPPLGPGAPPGTDFNVVQVRMH
jgi:sugar lactone lactonase YvrE